MEEQKNSQNSPEPRQDAARPAQYETPEIFDDKPQVQVHEEEDDAPTEWVPSRFERRVHAIPEATWKLYNILGGAAIGIAILIALFYTGEASGMSLIIAAVLAILVPRWLEDRCRRPLLRARMTMIVVIAVGLVVMLVYMGMTKGFQPIRKV